MTHLAAAVFALHCLTPATTSQRAPAELVKQQLTGKAGMHPRLLLNGEQFRLLRRQTARGKRALLARQIIRQADEMLDESPPAEPPKTANAVRGFGNRVPWLALAYRLTGQVKYLHAAENWMLKAAGYRHWVVDAGSGAGHMLFGLAVGYDWLYHELKPETRTAMRQALLSHGRIVYESAEARPNNAHLQNSLWIDAAGLATCGFALFDESDEVLGWIVWAQNFFDAVLEALGPDGATHEGVTYWGCGLEYLLKYLALQRDLLEIDRFGHPWLGKTGDYRLYAALPDGRSCVNFADSARADWCGPGHLLRRLAGEYRRGRWQWLADHIEAAGGGQREWLDLLWYDPSVRPIHPGDEPPGRFFSDLGLVFARSDWTEDALHVALKCGPPLGRNAAQVRRDLGGRHVHPDAASLTLVRGKDHILVDDGYTLRKRTSNHSTLLVDGAGQVGEGGEWFNIQACIDTDANPEMRFVQFGKDYDWYTADATSAYPEAVGLSQFIRHVLFVRPDVVVIVDELAAVRPVRFELLYQLAGEARQTDQGYEIRSGSTLAHMQRWSTAPLRELLEPAVIPKPERHGADTVALRSRLSLKTAEPVSDVIFIAAFDVGPGAVGQRPDVSVGLMRSAVELSVVRNGRCRTLTIPLARPAPPASTREPAVGAGRLEGVPPPAPAAAGPPPSR